MRVIINRFRLMEQLTKIVRFVSSNEHVKVLECVYMEAVTDRINLIGGNGTTFLMTKILDEHIQIQQVGKVAVHAKLLADIVRKMDEDEIMLSAETMGSNRLRVTTLSNRSTFILKLLQTDEYPFPEQMQDHTLFTIHGTNFRDAIRQTLFAVQKKEHMPTLTGVKMEVKDHTLIMIGCDRYRLGKVEQTLASEVTATSEVVIVPGRTLNELEKLIGDDLIHVRWCRTKIKFIGNDFELITHSITGNYPNVDISEDSAYVARFVVHTSALVSALNRVAIIASQEKTNLIQMNVQAEQVVFDASSQVNQALESLDIQNYLGTECKVSLNVGYALEALKALGAERVQIQINQGMQMILFTSEEKSGVLQLIMAARTAG
ncbi:DNA polymerase III, beta subunit [Paenibacillus polysaccharolyticus]|uniref:Beta sliding clamp n=1 Tax=Paenibacillus polysaccharolyticus TaxID=582692 RepID=A0A1G5BHY2_9BACL|nr:DNA polymerase III subunit beta [Paenibacillus polysaccharolyticus]SCX89717.1 DNA polymerase III, beta subunit [Paenibacillus polysaccharolyticus]